MLEIPKTAPKSPIYAGRFWSGITSLMSVIIDIIMPEAPRPVMARPTMSASMLRADAATTEPISKTVIETRKTILLVAKLWRKRH